MVLSVGIVNLVHLFLSCFISVLVCSSGNASCSFPSSSQESESQPKRPRVLCKKDNRKCSVLGCVINEPPFLSFPNIIKEGRIDNNNLERCSVVMFRFI